MNKTLIHIIEVLSYGIVVLFGTWVLYVFVELGKAIKESLI